jgi:peptidoglycan hydrolase CwlO-like protein
MMKKILAIAVLSALCLVQTSSVFARAARSAARGSHASSYAVSAHDSNDIQGEIRSIGKELMELKNVIVGIQRKLANANGDVEADETALDLLEGNMQVLNDQVEKNTKELRELADAINNCLEESSSSSVHFPTVSCD